LGLGSAAADTVFVSIKKTLDVAPMEARDAWIEYHFQKGGGLPILADHTLELNDDGSKSFERTIYPIFMKEAAEVPRVSDAKDCVNITYKVTEAGPFYSDVIEGSHSGEVSFSSCNESSVTVMYWEVTFSVSKWQPFYQSVTEWTISTAATTIQEATKIPRLFTMKTIIEDSNISQESVQREWLKFIWTKGGGLPLLPPIPIGDILEEDGYARRSLARIPPFITESITDISKKVSGVSEYSVLTYQLNNPGWFTFPFLLHTHLGRVSFTPSMSGVVIKWQVEIRAFNIALLLVETLTEMTVSTLLRNLRVRLESPDDVVVLQPPRGNTNILAEKSSLGSFPKESWVGGVLDVHLSDKRTTLEQTLSLIQPWSWGRTGNGDVDDIVQFQWSNGRIR